MPVKSKQSTSYFFWFTGGQSQHGRNCVTRNPQGNYKFQTESSLWISGVYYFDDDIFHAALVTGSDLSINELTTSFHAICH